MKKLYLDVETTGFNSKKDALIQIAFIVVIDGRIEKQFSTKVRPFPTDRINKSTLDWHGITEEEVMEYPAPRDAFNDLVVALETHVDPANPNDKYDMLAYNSPFDEGFMKSFFIKIDDPYYGSWFKNPSTCILKKARKVLSPLKKYMKDQKLLTVAKTLGIDVDEERLHEAMYDTNIAMQVDNLLDDKDLIQTLIKYYEEKNAQAYNEKYRRKVSNPQ